MDKMLPEKTAFRGHAERMSQGRGGEGQPNRDKWGGMVKMDVLLWGVWPRGTRGGVKNCYFGGTSFLDGPLGFASCLIPRGIW